MRFFYLSLIALFLLGAATASADDMSLANSTSGARMEMYLKQVDLLRQSAGNEDKPKYLSVQTMGDVLLDKYHQGYLARSKFDQEVMKLGVMLQNNNITDADASAWLDEVTPLAR